MRIVLLGAPGSGKGTQSQRLVGRLGIPQISTGDLLRAAVASGSDLGRAAKEAMDGGRLVDDSLVLGMLRERLMHRDVKRGFILDGFPRNLAQAHALDHLLAEIGQPIDVVVQLEVDYGELARRIAGRRTCADCGRVFNLLTSPPAPGELCPKTGTAHHLMQRPDDNEATVAERLRVYEEKTHPLIDFYRGRGLLKVISAEGDVDEVTQRLTAALSADAPQSTPPAAAPPARKSATRKSTARKSTKRARPAARRPKKKAAAPRRPAAKRKTRASAKRKARPAARRTKKKSTAPRRAARGKSSRRARR
jgi:adenylate kinase